MESKTQGTAPFSRIYNAIRQNLINGEISPGDQIKVNEAAEALRVSATPVREALSRLAGERLIEDRRRQGYFAPVPSAYDLIDLYSFVELCLLAALKQGPSGRPVLPPADGSLDHRLAGSPAENEVATIFHRILMASNNFAIAEAGSLCLDRLASARRVEPAVLEPHQRGIDEIARLWSVSDTKDLRSAIRSYHRLRRAHADRLAYAIASAKNVPNIV